MIRFKCPACQKILQVADEHAGKTIACPCGQKLKAPQRPAQPQAAQSPTAPRQAARPLAPAPVTPQPTPQRTASASSAFDDLPQEAADDAWLDDLPPTSAPTQYSQAPAGFPPYQPPPNQQPADYQQPAASAGGVNSYLDNAERELGKQHSQNSAASGTSAFNSTTLTGVFMMLGAAVWFVAGLMGGVIFFYPPILFILGMFSFGKGLLGGDD